MGIADEDFSGELEALLWLALRVVLLGLVRSRS